MGRLTTHILDTANGMPAAGVRIQLLSVSGDSLTTLSSALTNDDGRCDGPVLEGADFVAGVYELRFHIGDYFHARTDNMPSPVFLDVVPIRFGISSPDEHYHVPLLISPYGYSTYRGS